MGVVQDDGPVLVGDEPRAALHPWRFAGQDLRPGPSAAVDLGPSRGGMVEASPDPRMRPRLPPQVVPRACAPEAGGEAPTVPGELGDARSGRAVRLEPGQAEADRRRAFRLGIEADPTRRPPDEPPGGAEAPGARRRLCPGAAAGAAARPRGG